MKKILFVATVRSHIAQFHQPYLAYFKEKGYEVHVGAKDNSDLKKIALSYYDFFHEIDFERQPLKARNLTAYFQLRKLLKEEAFDMIHCHTPVGALLTRIIANKYRKNGMKVIYTAHGFHFYHGAPLINRVIYSFIERWLSRFTDCLITINEEDYQYALKHRFQAGDIVKINGVGVDLEAFSAHTNEEKLNMRRMYGYEEDAFIVLCAADLSHRKHQDLIINAVNLLKEKLPQLKVIFAGTGDKLNHYQQLMIDLGLEDRIQMIGYVREIPNYMALSDMVVSASRQEGLPINLIEAMASGLPIVATDCRGNRDLIENEMNGFLVPINDPQPMADCIMKVYLSAALRQSFKAQSLIKVQNFGLQHVMKEMTSLYERIINESHD